MKIQWYGQACFLLTSKDKKILIDPFGNLPGYKLPKDKVDVITVSHDHFDHNNTKGAKGKFKVIDKTGNYQEGDISITGIDTYHDDVKGEKRGKNIVFKYIIEDINLCHLGDLGHLLTDKQIEEIGKVDVLMIPVGGIYTIDAKTAMKVIDQIKPTIIIPMHYNTTAIEKAGLGLDHIDKFIIHTKNKIRKESNLEITKDTIDNFKGVVVLEYI